MRIVLFSIGLLLTVASPASGLAPDVQPLGASVIPPVEQISLTASDGGQNDLFGSNIVIAGDTALVGAPSCIFQCPPDSPGAAYVLVRDENTGAWSEQAKLVPGDSAPSDEFGSSVALEGDIALVGAKRASVDGNVQQGAVYVFERDPGSGDWSEQAKLTASDGEALDRFGIGMALSQDILLIGANGVSVDGSFDQGAVYVFERDGGTGEWLEQTRLTASDGAQQNGFGENIVIQGSLALIGAPSASVDGNFNQGKAYVFELDPDTGDWIETRLLVADGMQNARFGESLAIAGDSVLVGAPEANIDGDSMRGAVHVFERGDGDWVEQVRLSASDGSRLHRFGSAIAVDGETALIGADSAIVGANNGQGAVYIWARDAADDWHEQGKLTAAEGAPDDGLGASIAMADGTVLIGAPEATVNGSEGQGKVLVFGPPAPGMFITPAPLDFGSVPVGGSAPRGLTLFNTDSVNITVDEVSDPGAPFVVAGGDCQPVPFVILPGENCTVDLAFEPVDPGPMSANLTISSDAPGSPEVAELQGIGAAYTAQFKLIAADGAQNDELNIVAVDGDLAVVGAPRADSQGAAYIFARDPGGAWQEQARLNVMDGEFNDRFGTSVAVAGDTVLIGASGVTVDDNNNQGAVYVFERDPASGAWQEQDRLVASELGGGGFSGVSFGQSLVLNADTLLIGAPGADNGEGAVHVFERDSDTGDWSEQAKLNAENDTPSGFGTVLALDGDHVVVGAQGTNVDGNPLHGTAYVFERIDDEWSQQARLTAADGQNLDRFGISVALSGDTALIGAAPVLNADRPGAAYVFEYDSTTGEWTEQAKLVAADGGLNNLFGASALLAGDTALIGAPHQHAGGHFEAGVVYVFERDPADGEWHEQFELSAHDARQMDNFGTSLAWSGEAILVGAVAQVDGMLNRGAAYVFALSDSVSGLYIAPDPLMFSPVADGETEGPRSVTLINADGGVINVSAISAPSEAFSAVGGSCGEAPFSLGPAASCTLAYTFNPVAAGDFSETIEMTSDASSSPDSFTLMGAVLERELTVTPQVLDFDLVDVGDSGGPISVELANTGMLDVTFDPVQEPGGSFVLSGDSCGATNPLQTVLPVGETCILDYVFNPTAVGDIEAEINIVSDAPSSPDMVVLQGTGGGAAIELDPEHLSVQLPEGQIQTQPLTIANPGNQTLEWAVTEDPNTRGLIQRPAGTVTMPRTAPAPANVSGYITSPVQPAAGRASPALMLSGRGGVTISHSESLDVMSENSVACGSASGTSQSSFLRTFTLSDFDIATDFDVTEVSFGIENLTASASITVNLHTLEGDFIFANFTQIGTVTETFDSQQSSLVTVPVTGTVPAGATLVVEIEVPDLTPQQAGFFPGSNDLGESAPSYAAAPSCGTSEPTSFADLGAPHVHLVMTVTGEVTDCALPDWIGVNPSSGVVDGNNQQTIEVTLDALETSAGEYEANVCFGSNDPVNPLRVLPVTLTVTEPVPEPPPGKLVAADGAANDWFGRSVTVDGDTVLVSADAADIAGNTNQGAVYVFVREDDAWVQQAKLVADDGEPFDQFGFSVALSGDTALIGGGSGVNAAYVYTRENTVWSQQAKFTAADIQPDDNFGIAVALEGDTALIGARQADVNGNTNQGAAYVFVRSGDEWIEQAKLTAGDGEAYNVFGDAVAISGNTALVGAAFHNTDGQENQGAAYVFTREGKVWSEQAKLTAADGMVNDWFGYAVALAGDTAVVGANQINVFTEPGAAYVFTRVGESWEEQARLAAGDGVEGDTFGESVAIDGEAVLVGALFADDAQGAAYHFADGDDGWSEQDKLTADDGSPDDQFGKSVAIAGNLAVIGAWTADIGGNVGQGAAYIIELDIELPPDPEDPIFSDRFEQ